MNKLLLVILACLAVSGTRCSAQTASGVITGAQRIEVYLPELKGRRVGILTNATGRINGVHIVDSLIRAGVDLRTVFAPEHGFRGDADAGEAVGSYTDPKTGVRVVSIYGADKKPKDEDMRQLDVVLFDIQDVGLRYYTYLSSMHYLMEACAANGVALIVLDRPNPNGFYVDGPILDPKHKSFVGMHPIPVVHGMTLGELAQMIDGEGWLTGGRKCRLTVVPCLNYTHRTLYILPEKPSPNLPDMRSVYLYSSLCFFEGTPLSIGRGTDFPFQVIGHPALKGQGILGQPVFSFTPRSTEGAKNPPLKDQTCYGIDLRTVPTDGQLWQNGIDLSYLVDCYRKMGLGSRFFLPIFDKLTGVDYVRTMIVSDKNAGEIEAMWQDDVAKFRLRRKPYLLYEE